MPDTDTDQNSYATPSELALQREFARFLLGSGSSPLQEYKVGNAAAVSPYQGIASMLQTLAGSQEANRAAGQERATNQAAARNIRQVTTGAPMPVAPGQPQGGQPPAGPMATPPPGAGPPVGMGNDPTSQYYAAITAKQEGSGSYTQIGLPTHNGDRAYGKYGVMGANVPSWTKEATGTPMTPQQFLASPEAQEAVYKTKFIGQYVPKYGPEGAARAWIGGEGGMNNLNATAHSPSGQPFGATVGQYGSQSEHALAFNGEPQNAPTRGAAAANEVPTDALAMSRTAPASTIPVPSQAPAGTVAATGGRPVGAVPIRPHVSPQVFEAIIANPQISSEMKSRVMDLYLGQHQPVAAPGMGGTWVIDPDKQQPPRFVPDIQSSTEAASGASHQIYQYLDKNGQLHRLQSQGPQAPQAQPVAPQDVPAILKYNEEQPPQTGPLSAQPPGPGNAPPTAMAAIDQALQKGAQQPPQGPQVPPQAMALQPPQQGTAPPQPGVNGAGGPLAVPPPGMVPTSGTQTAQLDPQFSNFIDAANQKAIELEHGKALAGKDAESYTKKYDAVMSAGQRAQQSMPQFKMAREVVDDPTFISGSLAGPRLDFARLEAATGYNPKAAAATELFRKIISGGVVEDMKIMLQGLGQVRVAEINLLSKATGNIYNSQAANRAVLDIMIKAHQQANDLSKATNLYAQGYRYGTDGKVTRSSESPTNAGLDGFSKTWLTKHPLFTDQQIKEYDKLFDSERQKNGGKLQPVASVGGEAGARKAYESAISGGEQASTPAIAPAQGAKTPPPLPPGFVKEQP